MAHVSQSSRLCGCLLLTMTEFWTPRSRPTTDMLLFESVCMRGEEGGGWWRCDSGVVVCWGGVFHAVSSSWEESEAGAKFSLEFKESEKTAGVGAVMSSQGGLLFGGPVRLV